MPRLMTPNPEKALWFARCYGVTVILGAAITILVDFLVVFTITFIVAGSFAADLTGRMWVPRGQEPRGYCGFLIVVSNIAAAVLLVIRFGWEYGIVDRFAGVGLACMMLGLMHVLIWCFGILLDLMLNAVRRFRQPYECVGCGYNLTGNTSGRCPECGIPVSSLSSAHACQHRPSTPAG